MASWKHLKILKQGVKIWNKWRKENPDVRPNLRGADLSYTNLIRANLTRANLIEVRLSGNNLRDANLSRASLLFADLSGTSLRRTNLRGAELGFAQLRGAIVADTNFEGAGLMETVLSDIDLSQAIGLEKCRQYGETTVDHRTLELSDNLSTKFLRGCGLPDSLIDWYHNLHLEPIQFYSCFISYSSKNQDFADRLYADLQNKGVRCWLATEDLKIGDPFRDVIDQAVRLRDKLLLILSRPALQSEWVKDEVEAAFEEERKKKRQILFPIRIDDGIMRTRKAWAAKLRRQRHIGDFTSWKDHDEYQKAFDRLLRDLAAG